MTARTPISPHASRESEVAAVAGAIGGTSEVLVGKTEHGEDGAVGTAVHQAVVEALQHRVQSGPKLGGRGFR